MVKDLSKYSDMEMILASSAIFIISELIGDIFSLSPKPEENTPDDYMMIMAKDRLNKMILHELKERGIVIKK